MGFGLFFLSLLGGYIFNRWCKLTSYFIYRDTGYNLLFKSASTGAILAIISYFIIQGFNLSQYNIYELERNLDIPKYTILSLLSFLLGPILSTLINSLSKIKEIEKKAIYKSENWLEILFRESSENGLLIEVTLENEKVYVGWIIKTTDPRFNRQYFQMQLILSGYRNDELKIEFTTNYASVYNKLNKLIEEQKIQINEQIPDFKIIISISSLRSARPFNYEIYELFENLHNE